MDACSLTGHVLRARKSNIAAGVGKPMHAPSKHAYSTIACMYDYVRVHMCVLNPGRLMAPSTLYECRLGYIHILGAGHILLWTLGAGLGSNPRIPVLGPVVNTPVVAVLTGTGRLRRIETPPSRQGKERDPSVAPLLDTGTDYLFANVPDNRGGGAKVEKQNPSPWCSSSPPPLFIGCSPSKYHASRRRPAHIHISVEGFQAHPGLTSSLSLLLTPSLYDLIRAEARAEDMKARINARIPPL